MHLLLAVLWAELVSWHLHGVPAELGLWNWVVVAIPLMVCLLISLLPSLWHMLWVPGCTWPLCAFNKLRVAALRVVLCRSCAVIRVPVFACLAGVIAWEIVSVGPTIPIIVVAFHMVWAVWHVVSGIAAGVPVVVVTRPRAIVRIGVAVAIVVVAIAIVVVVSVVVVVVVVLVIVVGIPLPLLCICHLRHLHLHVVHLLLDLWDDAVEVRIGSRQVV